MRKINAILIIIAFVLSSCSFGTKSEATKDPRVEALENTIAVQAAAATMLAQTQSAGAQQSETTPTNTQETIVEVNLPTATFTATVNTQPNISATSNVNCRLGPYTNFSVLETISQGSTADILGKTEENGLWWKVKTASNNICWVTGEAVSTSGDISKVVIAEVPATPTPKGPPSWGGDWTIWMAFGFENTPDQIYAIPITMTQSGNTLSYAFVSPTTGKHLSFSGSISDDGMIVYGWLTRTEDNVKWKVTLMRNESNLDQFKGKWYWPTDPQADGENCGARNGASKPSPCRP